MEPALDERGDLPLPGLEAYRGPAAMEPALDERGDRRCRSSPTPPRPGRNGARSRRAGRPADLQIPRPVQGAAMEPALDERGDPGEAGDDVVHRCAAMEPALDERGDSSGGTPSRPPGRGRNGARSRRAGRPARSATASAMVRPQWSPLSTSGATRRSPPSRNEGMPPQWSPLSTSGATWTYRARFTVS